MKVNIKNPKISTSFKTERVYPALEDLEVTPRTEEQKFKSSKYGFDNVTVKRIESNELNIIPSMQKQIFEGLYDTVNVEAIKSQNLQVTPTTANQTFTGLYHQVQINGVTSGIDSDIQSENIKIGKNILGINGTFTSDATANSGDICADKIAYVNGVKVTGTLNEIKSGSSYTRTTYSSITDDPDYSRSRLKAKVNSNLLGKESIFREGSYVWVNMPYSSLISTFGITADMLKKGFTLWGVTGTLDISDITNSEDYATCLALSQSILGGDA